MKAIFLVLFSLFVLNLLSFIYVLTHERRSMWSGMTLVLTIFSLGFTGLDGLLMIEAKYPITHTLIVQIIVWTLIAITAIVALFVLIMIVMFIFNGIKIIHKEGTRLTNFLSLGMGIALIAFLFGTPTLGRLRTPTWVQFLYAFLIMTILYLIGMMLMYTLTSWINLINWHVKNKLDYVVVLGAGLMGKKVTPLLASRINRGIEIYRKNPKAKLIMTGGRGPGEDIPEGEAMAEYAINEGVPKQDIIIENRARNTDENLRLSHNLMRPNSCFCIVTSSYHVYRALVLAKRQGLQCIGYGAKTRWYFTLNAFIREFIAYLVITKRLQSIMIGSIGIIVLIMMILYYTIG